MVSLARTTIVAPCQSMSSRLSAATSPALSPSPTRIRFRDTRCWNRRRHVELMRAARSLGPLRLFGDRPPQQLVEDQARDCEFGGGGVGHNEDCVFIARHLEPQAVKTCPDAEIRLECVCP